MTAPSLTTGPQVHRGASLSADGLYRYSLTRHWGDPIHVVRWVMLNPSTADHEKDDATIRRCCAFARAWGYGGILVHNLFALRATDPKALIGHPDPIGPLNRHHLQMRLDTVCGWGANAERIRPGWAAEVLDHIRAGGVTPMCLGVTRSGAPRHPLYLASSTERIELR